MSTVVKRTIAEDGSSTLALSDTNLINAVFHMALTPLKAFSSAPTSGTEEFYSERAVGWGIIGAFAGGIFVGDKFGQSIPVLGQHRI